MKAVSEPVFIFILTMCWILDSVFKPENVILDSIFNVGPAKPLPCVFIK